MTNGTDNSRAAIQSVFAGNLKRLRKQVGLTQERLAMRSGLQRSYIGGIEQCRVNVSLKNVGKIADALGVSPANLLLCEGEGIHRQGEKTNKLVVAGEGCIVCAIDDEGRLSAYAADKADKAFAAFAANVADAADATEKVNAADTAYVADKPSAANKAGRTGKAFSTGKADAAKHR